MKLPPVRAASARSGPASKAGERSPTVKTRMCRACAFAITSFAVRLLPMSAPSERSTIDPAETFAPSSSVSARPSAS